EIDKAPQVLVGKTEMDGMIAYLQGLGIHVKVRR
ncbi:MAG: cytochrome-c oxidase, cbb3-type subunit II, partial [Acidiferrobacteraceae bacterium]|nr:cytochrome-c oxidase, cbb3-type subunit II [Acidiferrobacteraceae bacterium]